MDSPKHGNNNILKKLMASLFLTTKNKFIAKIYIDNTD